VPVHVVTAVHTRFVMRLVVRGGMALFERLVGVLAVNTAGLEALALVLRGTLLVDMFVVVATAVVAELALLALTMMTTRRIVVVVSSVQPVALVLIGEMGHLARVSLLQLLAHLPPRFRMNLFELMALEASIVWINWKYSVRVCSVSSRNLRPDCMYSAQPDLWKVMKNHSTCSCALGISILPAGRRPVMRIISSH
jgi:hypothetical protein